MEIKRGKNQPAQHTRVLPAPRSSLPGHPTSWRRQAPLLCTWRSLTHPMRRTSTHCRARRRLRAWSCRAPCPWGCAATRSLCYFTASCRPWPAAVCGSKLPPKILEVRRHAPGPDHLALLTQRLLLHAGHHAPQTSTWYRACTHLRSTAHCGCFFSLNIGYRNQLFAQTRRYRWLAPEATTVCPVAWPGA